MSRIGKKPVEFPAAVNVTVDGKSVSVKGPEGELSLTVHPNMLLDLDAEGCLLYTSPSPRDQRGSRMPSSA